MLKIYPDIDLIKRTDIKKKLLKKDQETFVQMEIMDVFIPLSSTWIGIFSRITP